MNRYTGTPFSFLNLIFDVVGVLLLLRFTFQLLLANTGNVFIRFLYGLTDPLVAPFRGIVPTSIISGLPIEWSTVVAMVIYGILVLLLMRFLHIIEGSWSEEEHGHPRHA